MDVESVETFEPVVDGTRMRWEWEAEVRGVVGRLLVPVLAGVLGRRLERAFNNIKRTMEGGASARRTHD